jgi:hypothetical protein
MPSGKVFHDSTRVRYGFGIAPHIAALRQSRITCVKGIHGKVIEGLNFSQSIIATHSSEIIGDVPFQNVTEVRKREKISRPSKNADQIQDALRGMGSLHSIQLAKLAQNGIILFVEGNDKSLLTDIAYKMGSKTFDRFSRIVIQETGGKGNWQQAIGAAKSLSAASGGQISTVLLLDRDYMLDEERKQFFDKSVSEGLILKIWDRKEIENYFVLPSVVARYISKLSEMPIDPLVIERVLTEIEAELREDVILSFSDVLQKSSQPRLDPKASFKRAKALVDDRIANGDRLAHMACGKDVITKLSKYSQDQFGVSFGPHRLCKEMQLPEIDLEIRCFVDALCNSTMVTPESFRPS